MPRSTKSQPPKPPTSSARSSARASSSPTPGLLTLTIKYTCPRCSEVHFHDFPLCLSMKHRTSRQLTMQCLTNSSVNGSLSWVTHGNLFMVSGELSSEEWQNLADDSE